MSSESEVFCDNCHVGSVRAWRATYARWHAGHFVVVPGVPAWRCDYCGDTFYDSEALYRLFLVLGPESQARVPKRSLATGFDENHGAGLGDRRRV
jgi:YgiT-type zinc finger domain-containing protein